MKKVLFVFCGFFGYEKIIIRLMEDVLGYKVYHLNSSIPSISYSSFIEKIYNNFFYKIIFKKNYKTVKKNENTIKKIQEFGDFDYIFCIRPDIIKHDVMKYLFGLKKKMILHNWDSLSWYEEQKEYQKYFESISSFDKKESDEYSMNFLPNFYLRELINEKEEIKYDAFTVMSYGYRVELLERIAKNLKERNIKYKFIVVTDKDIRSEYLTIQKESISIEETYKYMQQAKVIVEIGHYKEEKKQGGLSFRAIEALGCKRKLVTTYDIIKEYDFYDENNIKIISEDNYDINDEFFKSEYKEIASEVYKKYESKEWIKKIFKDVREN